MPHERHSYLRPRRVEAFALECYRFGLRVLPFFRILPRRYTPVLREAVRISVGFQWRNTPHRMQPHRYWTAYRIQFVLLRTCSRGNRPKRCHTPQEKKSRNHLTRTTETLLSSILRKIWFPTRPEYHRPSDEYGPGIDSYSPKHLRNNSVKALLSAIFVIFAQNANTHLCTWVATNTQTDWKRL